MDGLEALQAATTQAVLSRDDLLDMLSRLSQLYREQGDADKAAEYARLTREVYALFEDRTDAMGYNQGREQIWLDEEIWPRLQT